MSEEAKNDGAIVITDSKGRTLTIQEPTFLQESRITRLCGESSTNVGYMYAYVFPSIWVTAIDGNIAPFPTTHRELEGHMQRVGRHGVEAVLKHQNANAEEKAADHEADVKN